MLKTNMIYMFISQIVNYLFPLFLVPYLISVLDLSLYGVYVIFQTILFFGLLFVNYSYNITGVKRLSNNINNTTKIKKIFNAILTTRIFIFSITFIVFLTLPFFIEKIYNYKIEFFFILVNLLGYSIFPNWYFQGVGKFKVFMFINILYKSIQFILILLFVKKPDDFLILNIIYGVTPLLMAIHSLKYFPIKKLSFNIQEIQYELKRNLRMFLSLLFRNSNSSLIILYIGIHFQLELVAIVGALDKIVKATRSMFDPIFNVVFQYINTKDSKENRFKIIHKMLYAALFFGFFFILFFNIFEKDISLLLFHQYREEYKTIFFLFSLMPVLLILTNIFGIQTLVSHNYEKQYNNIMFISFLLTLLSIIIFYQNIYILILTLPIVELFILIATCIYFKRIQKV